MKKVATAKTTPNKLTQVKREKTPNVSEFDKNLAEVIARSMYRWLDKKTPIVSNTLIQRQLGIGYHKANRYLAKLEKMKIILPLDSKRGQREFCICVANSGESGELLEKYCNVDGILIYEGIESDR